LINQYEGSLKSSENRKYSRHKKKNDRLASVFLMSLSNVETHSRLPGYSRRGLFEVNSLRACCN